MSQAGQNNSSAGPVPPSVAQQYITDVNSPAIPVDNQLEVKGGSTDASTLDGIRTDGDSGGDVLTIQLTNRLNGALVTTDATPVNIITFNLSLVPTVYCFQGTIVAFNSTDVAGAAYTFISGIRTDGVTAVEISTEFKDVFEEAAMTTADFNVIVTGNSMTVQVVGIATKNIAWNCLTTYLDI